MKEHHKLVFFSFFPTVSTRGHYFHQHRYTVGVIGLRVTACYLPQRLLMLGILANTPKVRSSDGYGHYIFSSQPVQEKEQQVIQLLH